MRPITSSTSSARQLMSALSCSGNHSGGNNSNGQVTRRPNSHDHLQLQLHTRAGRPFLPRTARGHIPLASSPRRPSPRRPPSPQTPPPFSLWVRSAPPPAPSPPAAPRPPPSPPPASPPAAPPRPLTACCPPLPPPHRLLPHPPAPPLTACCPAPSSMAAASSSSRVSRPGAGWAVLPPARCTYDVRVAVPTCAVCVGWGWGWGHVVGTARGAWAHRRSTVYGTGLHS